MSSREPMNGFTLEYLREMNHTSKVKQEPKRELYKSYKK